MIEAGLAGEPLDLGTDGTLKVVPILDNTHTVQIGDGTNDMSFKVFLGDTNTFFLLDRATAAMTLQNVALGLSSLSADTINTNTLTANTSITTNTLSANTLVVNDALTTSSIVANSTLNAAALTMSGNLTVNGTLSADVVNANTVNITGTWSPSDVNTGTVICNTLNTVNTTVSGAFAGNAITSGSMTAAGLTVIPAVDDTGVVSFGNATKSADVKIFLGGANTHVLFDRGAGQMTLTGVTLNTDSSITVGNTLTVNSTLNATSIVGVNASVTGLITGNSLTTGAVSADSITVIPAVDDTGSSVFGNATKSADVKVFLGGATTFALFDRGNSRLQLSSVALNTNTGITVTGNSTLTTVTATTVNTGDLTVSNTITTNADFFVTSKPKTISGNTTLNSTHYGGLLLVEGANRTITLPTPVGNPGVWFDIVNLENTTTLHAVNATAALMSIVGNSAINTVAMNSYGETVRITSTNTKWVVSPYEGTTLVTT
jgi:hypothetical protein